MSAGAQVLYVPCRDGRSLYELSPEHLAAVTDQARAFLAQSMSAGDLLLIVGDGDDTSAVAPFARAAGALGCPYSAADLPRFMRPNLLAFFQQFRYRLVLGLRADVVEMIQNQAIEVRDVFVDTTIYATPEAKAVLHDASGVKTWLPIGPVVALDCRAGALHLHAGALTVGASSDGTITFTSPSGETLDSGVVARASDAPCGCGLAGPTITVASTR